MHLASQCEGRCDYQARAHLGCVAQVYYTTPMKKSEVKGYWCHACYTETRSDVIDLDGTRIRKARANSGFQGFGLICNCGGLRWRELSFTTAGTGTMSCSLL